MTNRFGTRKEIVNVGGFDLIKYGSLQKREREYLLQVHRRLLNRTSIFLDMGRKIAQELGIPEKEAWALIQSGGVEADPEVKDKLLPYLVELNEKLDQKYVNLEYVMEAAVMLLASRLDSLKEIAPDLNDAFGLAIPTRTITEFDKVPVGFRFTSEIRFQIAREIINGITEDIYEALVEFVANEERQWKPEESEQAEVDYSDPLA